MTEVTGSTYLMMIKSNPFHRGIGSKRLRLLSVFRRDLSPNFTFTTRWPLQPSLVFVSPCGFLHFCVLMASLPNQQYAWKITDPRRRGVEIPVARSMFVYTLFLDERMTILALGYRISLGICCRGTPTVRTRVTSRGKQAFCRIHLCFRRVPVLSSGGNDGVSRCGHTDLAH